MNQWISSQMRCRIRLIHPLLLLMHQTQRQQLLLVSLMVSILTLSSHCHTLYPVLFFCVSKRLQCTFFPIVVVVLLSLLLAE